MGAGWARLGVVCVTAPLFLVLLRADTNTSRLWLEGTRLGGGGREGGVGLMEVG